MGLPEWITRRAGIVILAWIVVAVLAAPLAAKLSEVMVTEETGFLPPTAESVKALEAVRGGGARAEPDAIIVVSGVRVEPGLYWSIADSWRGIDWRGASVTSWIDVADSVYSKAFEGYVEGINQSLAAIEGFKALWLGVLNASSQLHDLAELVNNTATLLAQADMAYAGYYQAMAGLAQAAPQLRVALEGAVALCTNVSRAYTGMVFDVVRAEFLLENVTMAYQTGELTAADVARVVAASNMTQFGVPPLDPTVVYAVFNYTLSIGGPDAFNNAHAAMAAAWIFTQSPLITQEAAVYVSVLANLTAGLLQSVEDPRILAAQGPQGVLTLYNMVEYAVNQVKVEAVKVYGNVLAEAQGSPLIAVAYEELAARNCTPDAVYEALESAFIKYMEAQGIPPEAAEIIAPPAAKGAAPKSLAARAALDTVARSAAEQGAPEFLVLALTSTNAVNVLVELDPNASGAIAGDPQLAAEAAARILEPISGEWGVDPAVIRQLAAGAYPAVLALELVKAEAPPEAAPLLEAFREKGVPRDEQGLLELATPILVQGAVEMGIPRAQAEEAVSAAVKVYLGESTLEEEASELAASVPEEAWPKIMEELRGSLISRDGDAFLVLIFNTSYDDVIKIKDEIKKLFESKGYNVDVKATGKVVTEKEIREAALEDVRKSDTYSMVLVFIVLAIVLESIVAVFMPFTGIGLGLAVALGLAYLLARTDALTVTTISRTVMFSTGLGLGIDYATLISRRFREERARRGDRREAAAAALRASARPIVAGAATAAIGFGSLALAWDFPFLESIGTSVPLSIALVAAVSLTFIPALLAIIGDSRILWWPGKPSTPGSGRGSLGLGSLVVRGAPVLLALVLVALVPAVYVHAGFKGSHDLTIMMPEDTESLEGMRLINEKFDPGVVYPFYIIPSDNGDVEELAKAVESLGCISKVGVENSTDNIYIIAVSSVNPLTAESVGCARQVREAAHKVDPGSLVGGMAAVSLDLEEILNARFYHRVLPAAVVLMFLSMLLAYGGVATALAAVAGVTIAAEYAIAASVYYFQNVEGLPVPWFLPITVFTAILGVGMDYNSFSISRAAEECLRDCSRDAVGRAVSKAALLVMGLALIMASAYGGLMLSRIPNLRMMGAALSLGVLFAGILASVALTPALIALLGRRAWWPWGPKAEETG